MVIYNLSCHSTICHKVSGSVLSLFNYYNCMQDCMFNLSKMCNFHTSPFYTNSQRSFITILPSPFLQPTPASARRMQITFRYLNAYFTWTASYVPDVERILEPWLALAPGRWNRGVFRDSDFDTNWVISTGLRLLTNSGGHNPKRISP